MTLKLGDVIPADCDDVGPLLLRNFKDDGTGHLARNDSPSFASSIQANHLLRLDPVFSNLDYEIEASGQNLLVCEDQRAFGEANKLLHLRLETPGPVTFTVQLGWFVAIPLEDGSVGTHTGEVTDHLLTVGVPFSATLTIPDVSYLGQSVAGWSALFEYDPTQPAPDQFRYTGTGFPVDNVGGTMQLRRTFTTPWQALGPLLQINSFTTLDDSNQRLPLFHPGDRIGSYEAATSAN